jgi:predicted transcriptional regulator of viral defense system
LPVIETEFLLAGIPDQLPLKVQISRWCKSGNLIQLRRGLYLLAEPFRKREVSGFYLASIIVRPSYISFEKALEFHGLIPEAVYVYSSVTTKRPAKFSRDIWNFDYRHVKNEFFWGYNSVAVDKQTVFIASPEKALLDLCYFRGRAVSAEYINELRLQNVDTIDKAKLSEFAKRFKRPGIVRAAKLIAEYIDAYKEEESSL